MRALALLLVSSVAAAQPAPAPADPAGPAPTQDEATRRARLNKQVEDYDWEGRDPIIEGKTKIERKRAIYVGASLAYAANAKVKVKTPTMEGKADFPAVFGAEFQAGYRMHPNFSVGGVGQLFLNMKPDEEDSAREIDIFAQATGHYAVSPKWDLDGFLAPGYSVLLIPGSGDAKGLAFRWGGGALYRITDHIGFAAEVSQQLGFQKARRNNADVDMKTSSVSLFGGIRFSL